MTDRCLMIFQSRPCAKWNHFWSVPPPCNPPKTVETPRLPRAPRGHKMGALALKREIKHTLFPLMNASALT